MDKFARHLFLLLFLTGMDSSALASLDLILPTGNHNLYEQPEKFYMRSARNGPDPWKGGMYGFTRNAKDTKAGVVFTRFHEGVDIAPVMRDSRGVPLDSVLAIDEGIVVHVNSVAGHSNYGKYIVVKHIWSGSPFYSLYAHLNDTWVEAGQFVPRGRPLGRLGYTGAGINLARAHLHFEIVMITNKNFQKWYDEEYGDGKNYHGYFNGMNLVGLNVARLYERLCDESDLTIRQFIEEEHSLFYSVLIPRTSRLDMLSRYPWLLKRSASAFDRSWRISFDASGLPVAVEPSDKAVKGPTLDSVVHSPFSYSYVTKSRVRGSNGNGRLSGSGERYMRLVAQEPDSGTLAGMGGLFAEAPEPAPDPSLLPNGPTEPPSIIAGKTDEVAEQKVEVEVTEVKDKVSFSETGPTTEVNDVVRSAWHIGGYDFTWKLSGKSPSIELMPIRFRIITDDDEVDDVGVDKVIVTCPELTRYGIGPPRVTQISEIVWSIRLQVRNRKIFAKRLRELDGKIFKLDLRIQAEGIEASSRVIVETRP